MMRPKFCVDEEVQLRSKNCPDENSDRTVVARAEFGAFTDNISGEERVNWVYQLVHAGSKWWDESALRKIPPEDRTSWEDCVWQPDDMKVDAP